MPKDTGKRGGEKEGRESQGFTFTDRRGQAKDEPPEKPKEPPKEPPKEAAREAPPPGAEAPADKEAGEAGKEAPPITFSTFVFSLSSSALIQLGEIPDPFTKKVEKNLTVAQQTIDLLGLLEQKTKGNLTEDEAEMLEAVLYDLRMRYLKASGRL
jgi:hypothetical protein